MAQYPSRGILFRAGSNFGVIYFASPHLFGEHLFFGFEENPNIVGRGLTVAVLGLLTVGTSLANAQATSLSVSGGRLRWMLFVLGLTCFFILLIFSNFRAGWLGLCAAALFYLCSSRSLSFRQKFDITLLLASVFSLLMLLRDYKGFG